MRLLDGNVGPVRLRNDDLRVYEPNPTVSRIAFYPCRQVLIVVKGNLERIEQFYTFAIWQMPFLAICSPQTPLHPR